MDKDKEVYRDSVRNLGDMIAVMNMYREEFSSCADCVDCVDCDGGLAALIAPLHRARDRLARRITKPTPSGARQCWEVK